MIDSAMRRVMIKENWTDTRCKSYKKLLDIEDTSGCISDQIRLWNRHCNERMLFMIEVSAKVKKQKEQIELLERWPEQKGLSSWKAWSAFDKE